MEHFKLLREAWERFDADAEAWVAIITGVGDAFFTGADLKKYVPEITKVAERIQKEGLDEIDGYRLDDGTKAVLRNAKIWKPIIAAVNGFCTAGGMEMLGGVDIRVAVPEAKFAVMEPKRGLFAGRRHHRAPARGRSRSLRRWSSCSAPTSSPPTRALRDGLPERDRPGRRAAAEGLRVRPAHHRQRAARGAGDEAERVGGARACRSRTRTRTRRQLSSMIFQTEDAKEGPKAFAEKRPPNWQGK